MTNRLTQQSAEHDAVEDDSPKCDLCGKTDCPDADIPEFSQPRGCQYRLAYEALRYDRCEYGCGRDVTNRSIRKALAVLVTTPAPTPEEG